MAECMDSTHIHGGASTASGTDPDCTMGSYKDFAVRVTEGNLDMIAKKNDGVRPQVESGGSYFITTEDPNKHNLILPLSSFRRCFKFVNSEREHAWNEVQEIHV